VTTASQPEFRAFHVDASAEAEFGVVLMGMDVERVLLALGLAALYSEPADVLRAVDHLVHRDMMVTTAIQARAAAAVVWTKAAPLLPVTSSTTLSGSPREAWEFCLRVVRSSLESWPSTLHLYLAVCWFRRAEVTRRLNESA
jgi:hypothetical protein